jgi:CO dehydrogenase/acetyl-CoA synthase alpha subunit
MAAASGKGRYETIRDYTLLTVGAVMLIAGTIGALEGRQEALALLGAGLTAWGLVPTLQKGGRD